MVKKLSSSSFERKEAKSSPSQKRRRDNSASTIDNNNAGRSEKQVEHQEPHDSTKFECFTPRSSSCGRKGLASEDGSITVRLSDPDVLDCPICFDSLTIPVYQCDNGHVVCSACCINLRKKCATCSKPIGSNRCRALEKVLESVKIQCPNAEYGCNEEALSYSEKNSHKLNCPYVPCHCPHSDCGFVASSKDLIMHFSAKHGAEQSFMYDYKFSVTLNSDENDGQPIIILQEATDGNLFILHNNVVGRAGNAISVSCIGPNSSDDPGYEYQIFAESKGCCLELKSVTKNIQGPGNGGGIHSSSGFLLIPFEFFGTSETDDEAREVEILIRSLEED